MRDDGTFWSGRVPAEDADRFPYRDCMDRGSAWGALVFDCDHREAAADGLLELPHYSWLVETKRGFHVAWELRHPVHKYKAARSGPLEYLKATSEFYAHSLKADPSFSGLGRNPNHPSQRTIWGSKQPYTLDQLANAIPFSWKKPSVSQSFVGRNHDVFRSLLKWAGRAENRGLAVLSAAHSINAEIGQLHGKPPLDDQELAGIARSVEKIRTRWERRRFHKDSFIERQACRGRKGGIRSGESRRAATIYRNFEIAALRASGAGYRHVAEVFGLSHEAVRQVSVEADASRWPLSITKDRLNILLFNAAGRGDIRKAVLWWGRLDLSTEANADKPVLWRGRLDLSTEANADKGR